MIGPGSVGYYGRQRSFFLWIQQTNAPATRYMHVPSDAVVPWLLAFALGLMALALVSQAASFPPEVVALQLVCLFLVLQVGYIVVHVLRCRRGRRLPEGFAQQEQQLPSKEILERQRRVREGKEDIGTFSPGLTMYMSCFSARAYSEKADAKLWRNIAGEEEHPGAESGERPPRHLHFSSHPSFSRRDGFALGTNKLVGPPSFQMGIRGDMTFTLFVLCQFTGVLPADTAASEKEGDVAAGSKPAVLFRLFANTQGNNGISLLASDAQATAKGSTLLTVRLRLRFGEDTEVECKTSEGDSWVVDPQHKYLLIVGKSNGRLTVRVMDVQAAEAKALQLADAPLLTKETVQLSNKDMTINEAGNWEANLQAFGCYDRVLSDRDVITLYDHYKAQYKVFDPTYVKLMDTIERLARSSACPFNPVTCSACRGSMDGKWDSAEALVTADERCRKAVGNFCVRNPSHPRCSCWSINSPAYHEQCRTYRYLFGGEPPWPSPPRAPPPAPPVTSLRERGRAEKRGGGSVASDAAAAAAKPRLPALETTDAKAEIRAQMARILDEEVLRLDAESDGPRDRSAAPSAPSSDGPPPGESAPPLPPGGTADPEDPEEDPSAARGEGSVGPAADGDDELPPLPPGGRGVLARFADWWNGN